jgi:NADH-quinone oxidoreductase subunit N
LFSETNFKFFFAYSSVGQIGFLLFGVSCLPSTFSMVVVFNYLIFYLLCNCLFFLVVIDLVFVKNNTKYKISKSFNISLNLVFFKELYKTHLSSAIFLTGSLLSFAGIPPFLGFFVKYQILLNLFNDSFSAFLVFLILLTNILTTYGYFRFIRLI